MEKLYDVFPIIETERLLLRKLSINDAPEVFEYFSDDLVTRYFGLDNFNSVEEAEKIIISFNKAFEERKAIRWGITLKETKKVIGSIGFHNINSTSKRVEVGYEITRKEWNKGYGKEALDAAIHYIFNEVKVNRIGATVRPENIPSQKLLKKCGFTEEGTLRDYQFTRGEYFDLIMYSLLKGELKKRGNAY